MKSNVFKITSEVLIEYDNIWFSSDSHFMHTNIIKYCGRPYRSSEEMDDALVNNWNKLISDKSLVFYLGDFSMNSKAYNEILPQLKFKKMFFILGNHDKKSKLEEAVDLVESSEIVVSNNLLICYKDEYFYLTHRPIDAHKDYSTICGHVHEKWTVLPAGTELKEFNKHKSIILSHPAVNVSVDQHDFSPISLPDVLKLI